ncbi:hypothetical protein CTAM01_17046 [Colletotrichum tamarilloi]|uniref:Xylanolytic transcriptional activator regulatory domain-containing protein n=1 Tax=Colletotrichum tamarilloi TaxID=1209934 RepID=A0ABQ9QH47_9PEZI|nr:uncharacterized protein CTAM01_17046 [Colletotrichum tamarilloi]KAK1466065.1 hypothetical protein CTAM01_17046 [Colletotrichum tamarilloi]
METPNPYRASGRPRKGLQICFQCRNRKVSRGQLAPGVSLPRELNSNKTIIKQHIDAFFDFVYPIPCYGFIHKATFCQSWAQDTYNPRLLKAMCGLTTRYIASGDGNRLQQATRWIQESEMQLFMRLSEPSMSDIEALMLTTLDHIIARRFSKMLVSACLAARLAFMMRLNYEDGRLSFLTQERRRRLMWGIYTMETLYSSGRTEFTGCPKETIHLQLPCHERSFTLDIPVMTEPLKPPENQCSLELGLMAYNIRVLDIRDRIQSQFANLPKDVLISKLKACSDILETPAEIYPTTKLLRGGIADLIHDVERDSGDSSPLRSNWEAEQPGSDNEATGAQQPGVERGTQGSVTEVYSKYSVTDEIRKLKFQQDGEEDRDEYQSNAPAIGVGADGATPQQFLMTDMSKEHGPQPYMPMPQDLTANGFGFSEAGFGTSAAPIHGAIDEILKP